MSATTDVVSTRLCVLARLRDGTPVSLRPQTRADRAQIAELFAGVSDEARYLRFGTGMPPRLPGRVLDVLAEVDGFAHHGILAVHRSRVVAAARYIRRDDLPAEAEVALTVSDAFQRRGLGRLLVEALREDAAAVGIECLSFEILPGNRGAHALMRSLGARRSAHGYALATRLPRVTAPVRPLVDPIAA